MAKKKKKITVDKFKRRCAAHVCFALASATGSFRHHVVSDVLRRYSTGLTDKERLIFQAFSDDLNSLESLIRYMAWHLDDTLPHLPHNYERERRALMYYLKSERVYRP